MFEFVHGVLASPLSWPHVYGTSIEYARIQTCCRAIYYESWIGKAECRDQCSPGILDEPQIRQIPVLFGSGRRLFEVLTGRVELELARVIVTPEVTHIGYRIVS